jgi:hypothetical protein
MRSHVAFSKFSISSVRGSGSISFFLCLCWILAYGFVFEVSSGFGAEKYPFSKIISDSIKRRVEIVRFENPISEREKLYRRKKDEGLEVFEFSEKGYDLAQRLALQLDQTGHFIVRYPEKIKPSEEYLFLFEEFGKEEKPFWGQFRILGHLKEYKPIKIKSRNTLRLEPMSLKDKGPVAHVALELKLVDSILDQVIDQKSFISDVRAEEVGISGLKKGLTLSLTGELTTKSLEKATIHVIEESSLWLIERMIAIPWRSKVFRVQGDAVFFEGDQKVGLQIGERLEIFRLGPALHRTQFSRPMYKIAEIRLEGYQDGMMKGVQVQGARIVEGDIVQASPRQKLVTF